MGRERDDDGAEAKRILAAGRAIYISDDAFPGQVIKKYPDGRREIVRLDENGNDIVIRKLS